MTGYKCLYLNKGVEFDFCHWMFPVLTNLRLQSTRLVLQDLYYESYRNDSSLSGSEYG